MTKQEMLRIMRLLSALESWGFSNGNALPKRIHEELAELVGVLEREILK